MQGCKFIRIEAYARKGPHQKNSSLRKPSMAGILDELVREPHACSHVESPKPPTILYGKEPRMVWEDAYEQAAKAVDKAGDRLKNTALVIVVGVATWPVPRSKVESDPDEKAKCDRWLEDAMSWVKQEFGTALRLIVLHTDEKYVNFHFALLPTLRADRRLLIGSVHPGHRAERECSESGGTPRQQKQAHKQAMTAFQDRYYQDVAVKHGLARSGPKRQRLTRPEWKARKQQLAMLAASHEKARQYAIDLKKAADRHVAERIADAQQKTASDAANLLNFANRRFAELKQKATHQIRSLSKENSKLENALRCSEQLISEQDEKIRALEALLDEQSPRRGPGF
jgi:hypothetical protein